MKQPLAKFRCLAISTLCGAVLLVSCARDKESGAYSGVIETDDLDVNAPFSAELISLAVDDGSRVSAGDTVAVLDTVSSAAALNSARAATTEARARLRDLRAGSDIEQIAAAEARRRQTELTLAQAQRDLERAETLHQQQLIDDKSFELAKLALAQAEAAESIAAEELARFKRGARVDELAAAEAAAERAESEMIARLDRYQKSFLIARHDGVVQLTPFEVGEIVPAGRSVVTIQNPQDLWVRIYIPEAEIASVTIGQEMEFAVDAHPGKRFTATVSHISSETEFTPRNVQSQAERLNLVFGVKLQIDPTSAESLRAGMPADFFLESSAGETGGGYE